MPLHDIPYSENIILVTNFLDMQHTLKKEAKVDYNDSWERRTPNGDKQMFWLWNSSSDSKHLHIIERENSLTSVL